MLEYCVINALPTGFEVLEHMARSSAHLRAVVKSEAGANALDYAILRAMENANAPSTRKLIPVTVRLPPGMTSDEVTEASFLVGTKAAARIFHKAAQACVDQHLGMVMRTAARGDDTHVQITIIEHAEAVSRFAYAACAALCHRDQKMLGVKGPVVPSTFAKTYLPLVDSQHVTSAPF